MTVVSIEVQQVSDTTPTSTITTIGSHDSQLYDSFHKPGGSLCHAISADSDIVPGLLLSLPTSCLACPDRGHLRSGVKRPGGVASPPRDPDRALPRLPVRLDNRESGVSSRPSLSWRRACSATLARPSSGHTPPDPEPALFTGDAGGSLLLSRPGAKPLPPDANGLGGRLPSPTDAPWSFPGNAAAGPLPPSRWSFTEGGP